MTEMPKHEHIDRLKAEIDALCERQEEKKAFAVMDAISELSDDLESRYSTMLRLATNFHLIAGSTIHEASMNALQMELQQKGHSQQEIEQRVSAINGEIEERAKQILDQILS